MSGPLPEDESRPGPEHSIAPRRPRTLGGMVYLAVLVTTGTGLLTVALGQWRAGLMVIGCAVLFAAFARFVISDANAGMLGIRRKLVDVATLLVLGGGVVLLALIIPEAGPL